MNAEWLQARFDLPVVPVALPYHPDCDMCCALGRCHVCLLKPGPGWMRDTRDGRIYHVCAHHLEFYREMQAGTDGHDGLDMADGLAHLELGPRV